MPWAAQAQAVRLFELRNDLSCRAAPVEPIGDGEVARIVAAYEQEGGAAALTPALRDAAARVDAEICGPVKREAERAAREEEEAHAAAKRAVRGPGFTRWLDHGHGSDEGDDDSPSPAVAAEIAAWRDRRPVHPVPGASADAADVVRAGEEWEGVDEETVAQVRAGEERTGVLPQNSSSRELFQPTVSPS